MKVFTSNGDERIPKYVTHVDVDGSTTYVGKCAPGTATSTAAFQITKLVESTEGDIVPSMADGDDAFDNIWDNRTSLTYV